MKTPNNTDERIARMSFATVYPLYLAKVEKKGRTKDELHHVIHWLCGFEERDIQRLLEQKVNFETFFGQAKLHQNTKLITGSICGIKLDTIENPLTRQVRYLDKLVDELAKGRALEKILRKG
jgi:hypothetical protein